MAGGPELPHCHRPVPEGTRLPSAFTGTGREGPLGSAGDARGVTAPADAGAVRVLAFAGAADRSSGRTPVTKGPGCTRRDRLSSPQISLLPPCGHRL